MLLVKFHPRSIRSDLPIGGFMVIPEDHWNKHLDEAEKLFDAGLEVDLAGILVRGFNEYIQLYKKRIITPEETGTILTLFGHHVSTMGIGCFPLAGVTNTFKENESCALFFH
jgi:hypothetical protein